MEMKNVGLIAGIIFLVLAIMDATGVKVHLQKQYRELAATRVWQKKQAILEVIFGIIGVIYFFIEVKKMLSIVLTTLAIIITILMVLNRCAFTKSLKTL